MASRLSITTIVLIVALRLATGWHFYTEGVKKLEPSFSSAGFLRSAKGPLAPTFKSYVTGPFGAYDRLGSPQELGSSQELGSGSDASNPSEEILAQAERLWREGISRLEKVNTSKAFTDKSQELLTNKLAELESYLDSQSDAVALNRHEAWRLEQMKQANNNAPYQLERIAEQEAKVWGSLSSWGREIDKIADSFVDQLCTLAQNEDGAPNTTRIREATTEWNALVWIDLAVKIVVLGSGICLFFGIATSWAACAAALFLCSVIVTQPPWVDGANLMYFPYQVVEVFALLFLASVRAGRWAGIDGAYRALGRLNGKQK